MVSSLRQTNANNSKQVLQTEKYSDADKAIALMLGLFGGFFSAIVYSRRNRIVNVLICILSHQLKLKTTEAMNTMLSINYRVEGNLR